MPRFTRRNTQNASRGAIPPANTVPKKQGFLKRGAGFARATAGYAKKDIGESYARGDFGAALGYAKTAGKYVATRPSKAISKIPIVKKAQSEYVSSKTADFYAPQQQLGAKIFDAKIFDKVKGNLQKIGIIIVAMFLSLTPLLSWIPYLQFFFILMFIYILLTPKSKIYSDVRERVEDHLKNSELDNDLEREALAWGVPYYYISNLKIANSEKKMSKNDIEKSLQNAIDDKKARHRGRKQEEELPELQPYTDSEEE